MQIDVHKTTKSTFGGPPLFVFPVALVTLRLRFLSSTPLPNIRKSDFAGLVEAKKDAMSMNLDIRGRASMFAPCCGTTCCCVCCSRGSERRPAGGSLARAQSAALDSRGRSASSAVVRVGLNSRLRRIRASSEGGANSSSPDSISMSASSVAMWSLYSSRSGFRKPGHLAAAMYCNS
jgi:hypothetical protein